MKRFSEIIFLLRSYEKTSLLTRLFVLARYCVCPWETLISHVSKSGSILDIGCGHGLLLHLASRRFPDLRCTGFDHDRKKIEAATDSAARRNLSFLTDSEIDRLAPSSFDCVTIVDVLYSVPVERWSEILSLAARYLKPNGRIIIKETVSRPRWKYYICLIQEFIAIKALKYTKGHSPRIESVDFYLAKIVESRFVIKEHRRVDRGYPWPHYLFIGEKG